MPLAIRIVIIHMVGKTKVSSWNQYWGRFLNRKLFGLYDCHYWWSWLLYTSNSQSLGELVY